ncbi:MAG: winged helix-turn-helix domain-containing protein [Prevotellaceae bacterium]|nr:winged helix-turn-helix domain-containing protein [Prevotellaceae bacterium]
MNKRIKIVWTLSVITITLIFCIQIYWLYNQYVYNTQQNIEYLKTACTKALDMEQEERFNAKLSDSIRKNNLTYTIRTEIRDRDKGKKNKTGSARVKVTFTLKNQKRTVKVNNIDIPDVVKMSNRHSASQKKQISKSRLDSILISMGLYKTSSMKIYKTKRVMIDPVFSVSGRTLNVKYSSNPLDLEAISFNIDVHASRVIYSMAWQLAFSILIFIILCVCMYYQIKTIIFQKRIDNLRKEFVKTMIYDMKKPPANEPSDSEAIRIGETKFFYSTNELHHGLNKVIITSRQAEILRILSENPNEVVTREKLLNEVWGDDSYSNSMALNVQISYLRRALKSDTSVSIEAIIKKGYVLKIGG